MEFVRVTFPNVRGVQIDGAPQGQTGELLGVQRGHHIFDLGVPVNYTPPSRTDVVAGTSQDRPMIIEFEPAPMFEMATRAARGVDRPATAARPRKVRKASKKKTGKKKTAKKKTAKKAAKKKTGKRRIGTQR